jgi:HK97 gp10 family phage protein
MRISIDINGLETVLDTIDDISDMRNLEQNLGRACALVERSAKQKAPKGTGELRRSITSKVSGTTGTVFTPLEYAPYVEYGTGLFAEEGNGRKDVPWRYQDDEGNWHSTSGMRPQPYMRPALEENRTRILEILKEGLLK